MPAILDVAIGTLFVFLLFSLVVSSLNEYILSLLDKRAKFLRLGLAEMFGRGEIDRVGPNKSYLKLSTDGEKLLSHGLINAFSRSDSGGTSPSYIPAGAFVTALLDMIGGQGTPLTTDAKKIGAASSFLSGLQDARPAAGGAVDFVSYNKVLSDFANTYATLVSEPAMGTPFAILNEKAGAARRRAEAQADLLNATHFAAVQDIIDRPANTSLKPELDALVQRADNKLGAFKNGIVAWFSLNDSRISLELATITCLSDLIRTTAGHTSAAIEAGINSLGHQKLKDSLLSLYRSVDGDVQRFKTAVEGWFNSAMDRVSGWYKRYAQKWMIGLGFILAAIFNVDTIEVVRVLSNNPNLAKAVADQAEIYVSDQGRPLSPEQLAEKREKLLTDVEKAEDNLKAQIDETAANYKKPSEEEIKNAQESVAKAHTEANALLTYQTAVARLAEIGIPIGWTAAVNAKLGLAESENERHGSTKVYWYRRLKWFAFINMLLGWGLTAIAASIGAPFWFDLLGRFVNIRAAGRPPGEKEATSTPTKPPLITLDTMV